MEKQNWSLKELASEQSLAINKLIQGQAEAENKLHDQEANALRYQREVEVLKRENEELRRGASSKNRGDRAMADDMRALELKMSKLLHDASESQSIIDTLHDAVDELRVTKEGREQELMKLRAEKEAWKKERGELMTAQQLIVLNTQGGVSATYSKQEADKHRELHKHINELKEKNQDLQGQVNMLQWKVEQAQHKESANVHVYIQQLQQ